MTEISFLIELLLNHKLAKETKSVIAKRIEELSNALNSNRVAPIATSAMTKNITINGASQAASTIALMTKHGDIPVYADSLVREDEKFILTDGRVAVPIEKIAQTPAAAAAIASRQQAIAESISGKIEKGKTSPRKW